MSAKHTPEPWFAVPYGDGNDTVICEDESGNQRIAFMAIPGSRDEYARRKKWAEIKANACLIAAAPEMAHALELARCIIAKNIGDYHGILGHIEKVQAKARGEA